MDFYNEDTIDAYLLYRMTEEEHKIFLHQVKTDEALSKELIMHQEIFDGITAIGDKQERDEIAAIQVNEEDCIPYVEELQSDDKRKKRDYFRYLALAASIVLFAGISFVLLNQTKNEYATLANQFYVKYTEQDRGKPIENNDQKDEAKKLLLSGMKYYEEKKYKQAIGQFENIIELNDLLYLVDSKWYASLAYLQIAKPEKAKNLLQEISNDPHSGKKNKEKARKLRSDIENIQAGK